MRKINAIDISPYGTQACAGVDHERVAYANTSYRHKSGLGFGAAASGLFGWSPLMVQLGVKAMEMACGTRHRVLMLNLCFIFGGATVTFTITSGRRDDDLVERIRAARDAMLAAEDTEISIGWDNFASISGKDR